MKKFYTLLIIIFSSVSVVTGDVITNLEKLEIEISEQERELQEIAVSKNELNDQLHQANKRIKKLEINRTNLNIELDKVKEKLDEINTELAQLSQKQAQLKEYANQRFFELYKKWKYSGNTFKQVINRNQSELSLDKALYYESYILKQDRILLSEYLEGEFELAEKREAEEFLLNNQDELIKFLQKEYLKLESEQNKRKQTLQDIANQEAKIKKTLIEYRAKALRFEVAFSSLLNHSSQSETRAKSKSFLADAAKNVSRSVNETDLTGLNGKSYYLPIENANLSYEFGRRKIDNFKDIVYNKGAGFSAPADTPVFTIAKGVVLFSGKMPGYDNVVIVNHGRRDYSLYGKLNQILVNKNDLVSSDSPIALLGQSNSSENAEFYFEIRKEGRSVNPKNFIRNWPK
jgi:septal ring factor EnvC (AmiA/AmiB activator)